MVDVRILSSGRLALREILTGFGVWGFGFRVSSFRSVSGWLLFKGPGQYGIFSSVGHVSCSSPPALDPEFGSSLLDPDELRVYTPTQSQTEIRRGSAESGVKVGNVSEVHKVETD